MVEPLATDVRARTGVAAGADDLVELTAAPGTGGLDLATALGVPVDGRTDGRTDGRADELAERVLDAALALVARWGVAKTSLADVAKQAGCSRATVYRAFPGGKSHLFAALGVRELDAYLHAVGDAVATGEDLADAVTRGLVVGSRLLGDHDAARFVLDHEPGLLLPFLGFKQVDVVYRYAADALGPRFERFVAPDRARWCTEWAARTFLSYLFNPADDTDLAVVDDARRLVERFIVPAFATA
jgi:AcrR family transcriptional regulator